MAIWIFGLRHNPYFSQSLPGRHSPTFDMSFLPRLCSPSLSHESWLVTIPPGSLSDPRMATRVIPHSTYLEILAATGMGSNEDQAASLLIIRNIIDDILGSVPFALGETDLGTVPKSISEYLILWPLQNTLGCSFATDEQRVEARRSLMRGGKLCVIKYAVTYAENSEAMKKGDSKILINGLAGAVFLDNLTLWNLAFWITRCTPQFQMSCLKSTEIMTLQITAWIRDSRLLIFI